MNSDVLFPVDPDKIEIEIPILIARQPIGDLYLAAIPHATITRISHFDVRRVLIEKRDFEMYLGIQRPLNETRVSTLEKYVKYVDATFPSSIIIAVDENYVDLDEGRSVLKIRNYREGEDVPSISIRRTARVLDGQHRIAGLEAFEGGDFDVSVTIFIGMDIADQAYVFSTVNLEQTKVNKSLAYGLFELARSRSPQKVCHSIAVALDRDESGPFSKRIKRLGVATPGRRHETITQATFVEALLAAISREPKEDRDILLRGRVPWPYELERDRQRFYLRPLFLNKDDIKLAEVISNFFVAVRKRWPNAWASEEEGMVLNKSLGFRALMRFLRPLYNVARDKDGGLSIDAASDYLDRIDLSDDAFTTDEFKPGSSGEGNLFRALLQGSGLSDSDVQLTLPFE